MAAVKTQAYVGIDLGGTNIQAGVLSGDQKILGRAKRKTKADSGSDEVMARIARTVDDAIADAKLDRAAIGGVGIGAPGAIDVKRGLVIAAVNLRWNQFDLGKQLAQRLKLPVTVDNDVNVAVWGEKCAGAARDYDDLLGIWVGTGIGGGFVFNGELFHGPYMTAGEIGHTTIRADAPLGLRTLENLASRTMITNQLTQLIASNHPSKLSKITGGDLASIRSKVLAEAVGQDDALTLQVLEQAAKYIGVAAANVVTLLSLPCVVIGGGLTAAVGKPWLGWIRHYFDEYVFPKELQACKIVRSTLGDDAGFVGAALLAKERVGDQSHGVKKDK